MTESMCFLIVFHRYVNRLCELHIPAENFTEAGFALLLHAELLTVSYSGDELSI